MASLGTGVSSNQPAFASSENDQERLENEINSILGEKAGTSPRHPVFFQYSENISHDQRLELLRKLTWTLNKITFIQQFPRLKKVLITNKRKESSYDYFDGEQTLSLSTRDQDHPWVSRLSLDPLSEDASLFIDDQSILRVEQLRLFPPVASKRILQPRKPLVSHFNPIVLRIYR